jgi:hypothetical protein
MFQYSFFVMQFLSKHGSEGVVVQKAPPALRRLRQEGHKFKASLGYIARLCLKQNKTKVWF